MTAPASRPFFVLECCASQRLGARELQNDSYMFTPNSAFVADGAGLSSGARSVADAAVNYYTELAQTGASALAQLLVDAPADFAAKLPLDIMSATTLVGVILDRSGLVWAVSHGDSTLLHIRNGNILTVNRLHNAAAELELLGKTPPFGAESRLTRSLSCASEGASEIQLTAAQPNDVIILLTDGFAMFVPPALAVRATLASVAPEEILGTLLEALPACPPDNATCLVALIRPIAEEP